MTSMSPGRSDRKRLKSEDPRKRERNTSVRKTERKPAKYRIDGATLSLAVIAVVLLTLIGFMLVRRPGTDRRPGSGLVEESGAPVIERVESPETAPEEPVVELGTPEETIEPAAPAPEDTATEEAAGATARLFFVKVSDEGKIGLKSVLRAVPSSGSPLTSAVNALLEGPRPGELSNDVLSLLPENSRLIGARVEGGVAFLDFSEDFRFNALGIEGYRAQVEQVVFTATEFPTVDKVQFLIEGQRIDFLGGEGFWVGGPLGRDDF